MFFRVQDDGAGIARADLPRLFEPFFTTGKGNGLGLAIVKRIVTDHEGAIEVEAAAGKGAAFNLFLPVSGPRG
jgi:signal transduction histidine kinase